MTSGRWHTLSSWHNAWLTASPAERDRLRHQLAQDHPDLAEAAERLIADGRPLDGFLETPALLVAASALAATSARRGEREAPPGPNLNRRGVWIAALGLAALAFAVGWWRAVGIVGPREPAPLVRFTVPLPAGLALLSAPAISPDGQRVAFAVGGASGSRLMVRELGSEGLVVVAGSEGAEFPFWSHDGEWVGFSAEGQLKKVAKAGGPPVAIEGGVGRWGGAWGRTGVIFQPAVRNAGLLRVPADGGRPEHATILDDAAGDLSHRFPMLLSDGLSFVYYVVSTDSNRQGMYAARPGESAAARPRRLAPVACPATYVAVPDDTHLLLCAAGRRIEARSFDPVRMRVGNPRSIDIPAAPARENSPAMLSATADVLVYASPSVDSPWPLEIGIVTGWRRLLGH